MSLLPSRSAGPVRPLSTPPWAVTYLILSATLVAVSLIIDQVGAALWDWTPRPLIRILIGKLLITAPLITALVFLLGRRSDPPAGG